MDELPAHARAERQEHCSDVGHVSREFGCSLNRANVVSPGPVLVSEMATTSIFALQAQLTYLPSQSQAEGGDAFSEFHLYVCLAFLVRWSDQLREMDFQVRHRLHPPSEGACVSSETDFVLSCRCTPQSIIMFLQSLPTQNWSDKDTELLLSEAFMWSRTFVAR